MTMTWFSGLLDLSFWQLVGVTLVLTHITIAGVTIFLHRCQAHRALDLHPVVSHFFRLWMWLTTGMITKEWAAIHRKHHAKCETVDDPHSPQIHGINKVLWTGVLMYVKESRNRETMERYGHGTPDDWIERKLYTPHEKLGVTLMLAIDVALFGVVPGLLVWVVQIAWIPFWAAGVINGIGHWFGYRSFKVSDASTNIVPWGILIGGEELHNNHHAYATSARLSNKWYEFDIGWLYIRIMETLGLARVRKIAPTPRFVAAKATVDMDILHSVIANRYDVMSRYADSLKAAWREEVDKLKEKSAERARVKAVRRSLHQDASQLAESDREHLKAVLDGNAVLAKIYAMREELAALWARSTASREQLLKQLQDWCTRAEASGIRVLEEFSQRLRSYAPLPPGALTAA
ncbi:MAG: fatty acid desaturase [Burkholderiales bacterium]|nr:fatty acid desaturase [Burkholderiales bacterium]